MIYIMLERKMAKNQQDNENQWDNVYIRGNLDGQSWETDWSWNYWWLTIQLGQSIAFNNE